MNTQPFKVKNIKLNSNVQLHIIDIEDITFIKNIKKKPLKFRKLDDFLMEFDNNV